jgi:RNA polymerase sigma-70 factor (sigma-E family)
MVVMSRRDDVSFVAFVRASEGRLRHVAWLLTGDHLRAEELVQETLVRVYGRWSRVEVDDAFAYCRRIMVNARTDRWRRLRREVLVGEPPDAGRPVGGRDLGDDVAARSDLATALRHLTPRERAVVVLRYHLDLSEQQTAAELRVSVGTVKSTASRALAKLRARMKRADDQPSPVTTKGA